MKSRYADSMNNYPQLTCDWRCAENSRIFYICQDKTYML